MSTESEIKKALNLFNRKEGTQSEYRKICADLGFLLRNDEPSETQTPVVYFIFGKCNIYLGNHWGAVRAFKGVVSSNVSIEQKKYAMTSTVNFIDNTDREISRHQEEIKRLSRKKVVIMQ